MSEHINEIILTYINNDVEQLIRIYKDYFNINLNENIISHGTESPKNIIEHIKDTTGLEATDTEKTYITIISFKHYKESLKNNDSDRLHYYEANYDLNDFYDNDINFITYCFIILSTESDIRGMQTILELEDSSINTDDKELIIDELHMEKLFYDLTKNNIIDSVKYLLDQSIRYINIHNDHESPLITCIENESYEIFELFVNSKYDVNCNISNDLPFRLICYNKNLDMFELLVNKYGPLINKKIVKFIYIIEMNNLQDDDSRRLVYFITDSFNFVKKINPHKPGILDKAKKYLTNLPKCPISEETTY